MLTSQKIDNSAPAQPYVNSADSHAQAQGLPFSNIFAAMFGENYAAGNALNADSAPMDLEGLLEFSQLDLDSLNLASITAEELEQLLPEGFDLSSLEGLNALGQLDADALAEDSELLALSDTEQLAQKLQDLQELAKLASAELSLDKPQPKSIAVKINELINAEVPQALITEELDRRKLAQAISLDEFSTQAESTLDDDLAQTELLGSAMLTTDGANPLVGMPAAAAANNAQVAKTDLTDAQQKEAADEFLQSGMAATNGVNTMSAVTEQTVNNSSTNQTAQTVRQVQPQVSGTAQTNYQVSWGASSESAAGFNSESGAGAQNSNGQGQGSQSLAQQQMMQQQVQRTQALDQQMALKAADEINAKAVAAATEGGDAGLDLVTSDRRTQLPVGLQTINVPVKSPQWGQSVAHRINFMANNQIQQAQISLNPEKLGPIQIKLHVDRDQQVHVSMTAQHGTTREAIEAAMPRLREMLEQSGLDLASVDVSDQPQFTQDQTSDKSNNATAKGGQGPDSEVLDEEVITTMASDNLVDYYA